MNRAAFGFVVLISAALVPNRRELRLLHIGGDVLIEKETIVCKPIRYSSNRTHIVSMARIPLFERRRGSPLAIRSALVSAKSISCPK